VWLQLENVSGAVQAFFEELLSDMLELDTALLAAERQVGEPARDGVVAQFKGNPVGHFLSSALTPMHYEGQRTFPPNLHLILTSPSPWT